MVLNNDIIKPIVKSNVESQNIEDLLNDYVKRCQKINKAKKSKLMPKLKPIKHKVIGVKKELNKRYIIGKVKLALLSNKIMQESIKKKAEAEAIKEKRMIEKEQAQARKREEKIHKEAERNRIKKEKQEALHKVIKSKKSSFFKKAVKNLNVPMTVATLTSLSLLAIGGYSIYKSGFVQEKYSDYQTNRLIANAINDEGKVDPNVNKFEPTVSSQIITIDEHEEEEQVEEVVEEKHEYINTYLYDNGYEFNPDITPDFLQSINPELSDNTAWLEIPGTNINYPFVLPNVDSIDEVDGIREAVDKSGLSDDNFMQQYFLHKSIALQDSRKGTLYLDVNNHALNDHYDELSDMNVIYGHHMSDGTMFTQLMNWKYDVYGTFNEKHPFAIIYTDDGYGYQVTFIASRICDGNDVESIHAYNFDSYEDKKEYIESTIENAHQRGWFALDDYEVQEDDKYMSFVTCTYEKENHRFQLIGKLERIKVRDTNFTNNENGYYVEENHSTLVK